jgi:hypothetical protein
MPALRALFLGDIIVEENEISWIVQSDVSPLLDAFPALEELRVRGGQGLTLGAPRHARLRSLAIETGGLDAGLVRSLAAADLPELEHLELWLGTTDYGGTVTVADLEPILSGRLFPKLRYLGLRDSEIADEVAAALASAPILERVRVLDLSLGTLGDAGAAAVRARSVRAILAEYVARRPDAVGQAAYGIRLDEEEQRRRYAIKSLLQVGGLSLADYRSRFGSEATGDLPQTGELVEGGLAAREGELVALTEPGLELSDAIGPWLYSAPVSALMAAYDLR